MLTHFLRGCWETNNFAAAHYGLIKYIHIFMTVLLKQQAASVPCLCSLCTMGASFSSVSLGTTPFIDPKKKRNDGLSLCLPFHEYLRFTRFCLLRWEVEKKTKERSDAHNSISFFLFLWKGNIYLSKSILFICWADSRKDFGGRTYTVKSGFAEAIKKGCQEIILGDQKSV